ncbi:MAG TPA: hypothetical protein PK718_07250 [Candidatus Methanofastidiosa archaeon]|nr:hypothetical protein [Candidatus Methanofastidiosa archaeon]
MSCPSTMRTRELEPASRPRRALESPTTLIVAVLSAVTDVNAPLDMSRSAAANIPNSGSIFFIISYTPFELCSDGWCVTTL